MKLLNGFCDWKVSADLKTSLQFPVHIILTEKRTDIVVWSDPKKNVVLIELTVPWEENRGEAHERKKNRYETRRADCVEKGWICNWIPIEVDCRGFLGHSVILFLSNIEITSRSLKVASFHLQTTVQYALSWIWSRAKRLQHKMHAESPFPCNYVISRNDHYKCVMTSTAESKRAQKSQTTLKMKMNV